MKKFEHTATIQRIYELGEWTPIQDDGYSYRIPTSVLQPDGDDSWELVCVTGEVFYWKREKMGLEAHGEEE